MVRRSCLIDAPRDSFCKLMTCVMGRRTKYQASHRVVSKRLRICHMARARSKRFAWSEQAAFSSARWGFFEQDP